MKSVRWEDIWPPACNIDDSRTPPKGHGTNLAQHKNNGCWNGKSTHHNNGQHNKTFFKKKFTKQPKTSWKNKRQKKSQLEKTVDGTPVCSHDTKALVVQQMRTQGWMDQLSPLHRTWSKLLFWQEIKQKEGQDPWTSQHGRRTSPTVRCLACQSWKPVMWTKEPFWTTTAQIVQTVWEKIQQR